MRYEQARVILSKLGLQLPPPNAAGWSHLACPYAPWRHARGTDRSKGFAVKVEDNGISAFKCPSCKAHGRLSGLARGLAGYRGQNYDDIAIEADSFDMMSSRVLDFDEQFAPIEEMPEPLDEEAFSGLFEQIADYPEARRFMVRRGVSRVTCEKLKLEFDAEKRRIVFPVRDGEGRLYGWSGRTVIPDHEPKVLDYAGLPKTMLILGEERWRPGKPKLIVEGLFAYARMHEIGAEEIIDIGALLGSALTDGKAAILKRHGCTVMPLMDPDKAGDVCLFGQWHDGSYDQSTGEVQEGHFEGGGLVDVLAEEIPIALPFYPAGVTDPDNLTIEQLQHMVGTAQLQGQSKRWLDKKSRGR